MTFQEKFQQFSEDPAGFLQQVDWNTVGTWHLGIRAALWGAAFILVLVLAYFLQVKSLNLTLLNEQNREQTLKQDYRKKARDAANLEEYRKQMVVMEEQFAALLRQLPQETEVPGLLEDIDERGEKSGLNISSINLEPEIVKEFYIELPIKVAVTGSYHDFGAFVSGIAGMPRIVTLHDYEIKVGQSGLLAMDILAKTYRYKEEG